ncbi:MAG: FKBP-type peptidyl-prolyl cis-trans isomerase [Candidatus Pacebacteria bacterium]|jgi:peptidylprolyl isomerase|nr:peptidylprolyl isomerase [bacterium]MDP6527854.1 FKBP-type peptidyl-prolyl cis-trans isomerase [Candidatus Paceibacterota bacterium]MDP6659791.1 FKBP-type peptidyl-prolyl cis-trans isomerase [Candidatus Paceibacterota bacterium]|tara:strand:+ start:1025 stop:1513 length:489 start_codon:yes stop_codon:yes gene_type:complete
MKKLSKNENVAVFVSLVAVVAFFLVGLVSALVSKITVTNIDAEVPGTPVEVNASNLAARDLVVGEGAEAVSGKVITVHYVGTLDSGQVFDSSVARGTPFTFTLGVGQVIQGWELGVRGMKVGGKRTLIIPPELAYGAIGGHPLQTETLNFEVELLDVKDSNL